MMAIPSVTWIDNQEDTSCPVCNAQMTYGRAERRIKKIGHRSWHIYMMDQLQRATQGFVLIMDDQDRDYINAYTGEEKVTDGG